MRGSTTDDEARDRWGQNEASLGLSVLVHLSLTSPPKCYSPCQASCVDLGSCDTLLKSLSPFSESFLALRPCFLAFAFASRARQAPRGSRKLCQQELMFSVCCQALHQKKKAPFPSGISELASQASGASLHQKRFRKSRPCRGVWLVWASPSSAYIWVRGCSWQRVQLRWLGGSSPEPTQDPRPDITQASPAWPYFC